MMDEKVVDVGCTGIMESVTAVEIPEEPAPPPISDETRLQQTESWTDFTEKTTFHGLRYIFEKPALKFRRRIWLLVVMTAVLVFVIQVGIRTGNYLEYKTTLDVGVVYKDNLEFPAITICNKNRHRTTVVVDHGLYDVLDEIFKSGNVSQIPWEKFGDRVNDIDYGEFTRQTGHQKDVFINSCTWNGIDCDIDKDFKAVLTHLGLCYTFNGQENVSTVMSTPKAGPGSGLKLVINVEQYEYMRGSQDDAGIKIFLHPPGEMPIIQEQGFAAAYGTHNLVTMQRSEVITLQSPYGNCHPNNPPISQCYAQCEARDIINTCRCRTEYMQPLSINGTITCDFKTSLSCVRQMLAEMTKSESECACRPPCKQVRYEPQLSYAQLSKFNIDRMILDNPDKQKQLEESYSKARETTQRYVIEIRSKDEADMTRLVKIADRLRHSLQNIREQTTDPLTTSRYYNLPNIMTLQFINIDYTTMHHNLDKVEGSIFKFIINMQKSDSDIMSIQKELLYPGVAVVKFLSACLEEATAAQKNNSLDGSGDLDFDLPNNSLIYVSALCKAKLLDYKANILDYLHTGFSAPDFREAESIYQNITASMFQNSTESSDAFNDHKACLHAFGLAVQEAIPELHNTLWSYTTADTLENFLSVTNKTIISVQALIDAHDILDQCLWVKSTLEETRRRLEVTAEYASVGYRLFLNSFNTMSETMCWMAEGFEGLGNSTFKMITAYMNENATKIELARHMISPLTTNAIENMLEAESYGHMDLESLQVHLETFMVQVLRLHSIIYQSPLRIMEADDVKNLEFFKLAYDTNRTEFQHLIDGISDNMTNVQQLLDLVYRTYDQSFEDHLGAILEAFTEISDHLAMFQDDLQVYEESSALNVNFFMENFLQLDIFYKDMSYEVIAQHEAFGLLSLLGEVGGFLGLLLGASVITVCELLDYLLLHVATRCAGRRKEDPNVVTVESAEKGLNEIST